jgi:transcriptional/translational regulatory protein YebC/TACO1
MFNKRGMISIDASKYTEDQIMEVALEAGADDIVQEDGTLYVYTEPGSVEDVRGSLESASIEIMQAEASMIPQTYVKLSGRDAETMLKLMEKLEDHDDVQNVYSNFDIDEEEMNKIMG